MTTNAEARRQVARRVKAAMVMADVDQRGLASQLGVAKSTLSQRLNGSVSFNVDEIWAIAQILDVSPLDLLPVGVSAPAA